MTAQISNAAVSHRHRLAGAPWAGSMTGSRSLRAATGIATLVVAIAAFLSWPAHASAHAELLGSSPADGSATVSAPASLRLDFSEPILLRYAEVKLIAASGRVVASITDGGTRLVPTLDGAKLTVALPPLADGTYKVLWRSVSADDFHPVGDQFVFAVGAHAVAPAATHAAAPAEPRPRAYEALARWASFAAIALLAGLFTIAALAPSLADRVRRPARGAFVAAVATSIVLLLVQISGVGFSLDSARRVLLATGFGEGLLVRLALLLLALDGLLGRRFRLAAGLVVLAAAAGALGSHASGVGALAEAALAVHLGAVALWVGLAAAAAVVAVPILRRPGDDRVAALDALRRVGWVAGPAAGVAIAAGLYSAGEHVATPDALVTTIYGGTLIAKTVLVGLAGALALIANRALRTIKVGAGRVRRALPVEAAVLVLVLLGGAVMAAGAPARGPRFLAAGPARGSLIATASAADLLLALNAKPNRPGSNFLALEVIQTLRPPPGEVTSVTIAAAAPGSTATPQPASKVSDTEWDLGDVSFGEPGTVYTITTRVERQNVPAQTATLSWTVGGAQPDATPTVTISRRRLAPITTALAALVALGTALGVLLAWRRHGRPA